MFWKSLFTEIEKFNLIFFEPITKLEIKLIEDALSIKMSGSLLELLKETNGIQDKQFGDFLVGNAEEIIILYNLHIAFLKNADIQPPHKILFFANNGCGEYFGFRTEKGQVADGKVGVYYPIENEFRIVAPNFETWAIEWHTGLLST